MPVLPIGFAHRGARAIAPENTLAAFRTALQLGATGLETDAWVTLDGSVVLDHDGLIGPPWRRRPIAQLPRAALPAHIPTLRELYEECGGRFELSVDIKDPAAADAVVADARAFDATDRLWLCHPDFRLLAGLRQAHGEVHLVHSTSLRRLADDAKGQSLSPLRLLAAAAERDRLVGVDAVNLRSEQWRAPFIGVVHDAGLLAFGWDAQRPATLDRLLLAGIDGLYCDHVARMVEAIARSEQRDGR